MKLKYNSINAKNVIAEETEMFPQDYDDKNRPIVGINMIIDDERTMATGKYHQIFFKGVCVKYVDVTFKDNLFVNYETDFDVVKIYMILCGKVQISFGNKTQCIFDNNTYNIINAPATVGEIWFPSGAVRIVEINIMPYIFERYIHGEKYHNSLTLFLEKVKSKTNTLLSKQNLFITLQMHQLVTQIINCNKKGLLKKMYIEAKVIELILLQLGQMTTPNNHKTYILDKTDFEKIHFAKEILLKNIENPYSLPDLAKKIGTNEYKLKRGFKEVFGTTVFGMLSDIKMEKAIELLETTNKTITEISEDIGYKNPTHFTSAFKKKFGTTPKQYKKDLLES